ncbi:ATP-dependent Clp protease adaptor ClpS [Nitrospirota bacterium]
MATKALPEQQTTHYVAEPWNVILLNDEWHTFDEVIIQLMRAINCTLEKAEAIAWEVHTKGESLCFTGSKERGELVASILEEIELKTRLEKA